MDFQLSKRELSRKWLESKPELFRCIHCEMPLRLKGDALVCVQGHQFDMNRKGNFFLSKKTSHTKYDQNLFASRRKVICESPFYSTLDTYLAEAIKQKQLQQARVLDAGSGEGSHLFQIQQSLPDDVCLIGIDLAKEAINAASDYNGRVCSAVADLTQIPIQNHQIDCILSIFSPANYSEFSRILAPKGEVIKVIPNAGYLLEIRQFLMKEKLSQQAAYSNADVREIFEQAFAVTKREVINQRIELDQVSLHHLVEMTPLTWSLNKEQKERLALSIGPEITLDVTLLHGQRKS